jgi:uncharacterized protein (TIGR00661 family)
LNIAVSLNGEGSGHATRMAALCQGLCGEHRILLLCPDHTWERLRPRFPDSDFVSIPHMKTVYRNNSVDIGRSVACNVGHFLRRPSTTRRLAARLQGMGIQALISDYEPFGPLAAKRAGIPVLLFNHQGVVDTHRSLKPSWFLAWFVNRVMMPYGNCHITSSFYGGDVGPLIRPEITGRTPTREDFVFVYAREAFREHVIPVLDRFPDTKFRVFPSQRHSFTDSLASCRGLVAPAGHQLISECLSLGKPLLVFPQQGQYEQELNARMLAASGWGMVGSIRRLPEALGDFLAVLDRFPLHGHSNGIRLRLQDDTGEAVRLVGDWLRNTVRTKSAPRPRQAAAERAAAPLR